jgi:hypothetical protein
MARIKTLLKSVARWGSMLGVILAFSAVARPDEHVPTKAEILERFIPATELEAIAAGDHPGALLTRAEYEALLQEAGKAGGEQPLLPDGVVLSQTDYQATIENDHLRLTITVHLQNLKNSWQTAVIHVGGLGVLSAELQSGEQKSAAPVARIPEAPDDLVVFLKSAGEQTLVLNAITPLNSLGSDQSAAFRLPGAPAGQLTLTTPPQKQLLVDGSTLNRPAADDQPANYTVSIGGRQQIQLTITDRRSTERADRVTFATTAIGVTASPGEASWAAQTRLSVFGKPIDRLECEVPSGLEITAVDSLGLEGWELADAGQGVTRITLTWRQPFDGLRPISLRGVFSPNAEGRWSIPHLILKDVASHTGMLVIRRPAGVRLQVVQSSGLRQTSSQELASRLDGGEQPAGLEDPTSFFFQIWREDFSLDVIPIAREREVQAAMTTLLSLDSHGADLLATIDLETRFAPLFEADLDLPAAWSIETIAVAGAPMEWRIIPREAGRNRARVTLTPPLMPGERRNVTLTAHFEPQGWPVQGEAIRVQIPDVRLPQAGVIEALYGITAEDDLDIAPVDISGLDPARQSDLRTLNRQLAPFGKSARLGFTFQDTVFSGQLDVRRMPARVSSTVIVLTRIEPEVVLSHVELQVALGGGGLRELIVALPESIGSNVRFRLTPFAPQPVFGPILPRGNNAAAGAVSIPNILEQVPGTAANGVLPWIIKLDRYARGQIVLQAEISQPRPAAAAGAAPASIAIPRIALMGAERESGAIGVEASDDQHLVVTATSDANQPLERLDPIDFPPAHSRPRERLVSAFAFHRPGWTVNVTEDRLTRVPVPTAIIHKLNLDSIMDSAGLRQTQADAELTAIGVQSIQIQLPEGSGIWAALVDGSPVEVRRTAGALTIPLSPVEPADKHRSLRLIYAPDTQATPEAPRPLKLEELTIRDDAPRFAVVTGQGQAEPLDVLESQWTVHHAPSLRVVKTEGVFHRPADAEPPSYLKQFFSSLWLPSGDIALLRLSLLAAVPIIAAILALLARSTGSVMAGCLVVAVIGVGLVILSLTLPAIQNSRETARSTEAKNRLRELDFMAGTSTAPAPTSESLPSASYLNDDIQYFPPGSERLEAKDAAKPAEKENIGREIFDRESSLAQRDAAAAQEPAMPPQTPPAKAPAKPSAAGAGLLSVPFAIACPTGFVSDRFQTTTTFADPAAARLTVRFTDRAARDNLVTAIALLVALLGWWLRNARVSVRAFYLLLTIGGAIACRNLITDRWSPVTDGVWFGGLIVAALWILHAIATRLIACCAGCCGWRRVAAVMLAGAAMFATNGHAADPLPLTPESPSVYVPVTDAADPLSAKNVFVPQDLFRKLWLAAHPDQKPAEPAPSDGVVSAASLVADLTKIATVNEGASGGKPLTTVPIQGRVVLENFRATPVKLRLPIRGIALKSAKLDGGPAIVEVDAGDASLRVLVSKTGLGVLDFEFDWPVEQNGPAGTLTLQTDPVAAGRLTVTLPAEGLDVRLNGTLTKPNGNTLEVAIDRGGQQIIAWQPPTARAANDSPLQLESVTFAAIDDSGLTMRSAHVLQVRQGSASELIFVMPEDLRLKRVEGPDVAGWRIDGEGADRKLTVSFLRKIDSRTEFAIEIFRPLEIADKALDLKVVPLSPQGVARESGRIGVYAESQFAVRPADSTGLIREELTQFALPSNAVQPRPTAQLQYAYRLGQPPFSLDLTVERRQPETRVVVQHGVQILRHKQQLSSRIVFQISGAPRSTLSILLPSNYLLVDVTCPVLSDYFVGDEPNGEKLLTVELNSPQSGPVELILDGVIQRQAADPTAVVNVPKPQQAARIEAELAVWVDDMYTASIEPAADWKAVDPATLNDTLKSLRPEQVKFAYRSTSATPAPLTVSLTQQQPELTADALALIAVTDDSLEYGFTLQWKITRGATDTLSFTTPGWLRGRLDFAGSGIRQTLSTDIPNDRVRWTILLTDPVRDRFLLTAAASLPAPADGRVNAPNLNFDGPPNGAAIAPLEVQREFAVVVNLSRQTLSLEDPAAVETVARTALPLKIPDQMVQQAMSIVRLIPGRQATWLLKKFTATAVQAMVSNSVLETSVEQDGAWRTKATYTIRNRGRQYLPLDLSDDAKQQLLSVIVKGRPSRTVSTTIAGKPVQLVPLPPSSEADLSYDVVVHLTGRLNSPLPETATIDAVPIALPGPRVISPNDSAEYGIPVAQTSWRVTLPEGVEAHMDDNSNLVPHQSEEWAALAEAQQLTRLSEDIAEMTRIAGDNSSSYWRRTQARDNLKTVEKSLKQIERSKGLSVSSDTSGPSKKGGKAAEMEFSNDEFNVKLQRQVQEELSKKVEDSLADQTPVLAKDFDLSFRQGSFGTVAPQTANPQSESAPVDQKAVGKNFILGNSLDILSSNSAGEGISVRDSRDDFGFNYSGAKGDATKSQALVDQLGRGRRSLKSRIATQDSAQNNLSLEIRQQQQLEGQNGMFGRGTMGGMGGGMGGMGGSMGSRGMGGMGIGGGGMGGAFGGPAPNSPEARELNFGKNLSSKNAMEAPGPGVNGPGPGMLGPVQSPTSGSGAVPPGVGYRFSNPETVTGLSTQSFGDVARQNPNLEDINRKDMDSDGIFNLNLHGDLAGLYGWTQVGGLSLPIEEPKLTGTELAFSKSGGHPQLLLKVRAARARTVAWSLIEVGVWILAGIWLLSAVADPRRRSVAVAIVIALVCAATFLLIPGDERWIAFGAFAVAVIGAFVLRRETAVAIAK